VVRDRKNRQQEIAAGFLFLLAGYLGDKQISHSEPLLCYAENVKF